MQDNARFEGLRGSPTIRCTTAGGIPLRFTSESGVDYLMVYLEGQGPDKDALRVVVTGETRKAINSKAEARWNATYNAVRKRMRASASV